MAIIICKSCGKKVSDTVDICIHCGKSPTKEITEAPKETNPKDSNEVKKQNFFDLNQKQQFALESEFLKQDKFAKRYMLDTMEFGFYITPLCFYPILAVLALRLIRFLSQAFNIPLGENVINETFSTLAAVFGIGLIVLCACMFIYGLGKKVYNLITQARFVYMKKFQKWLIENKDIVFYPELKNARQKAIFDAINI